MTLRCVQEYVGRIDQRPMCDGKDGDCTERAIGLYYDADTFEAPDLCEQCRVKLGAPPVETVVEGVQEVRKTG